MWSGSSGPCGTESAGDADAGVTPASAPVVDQCMSCDRERSRALSRTRPATTSLQSSAAIVTATCAPLAPDPVGFGRPARTRRDAGRVTRRNRAACSRACWPVPSASCRSGARSQDIFVPDDIDVFVLHRLCVTEGRERPRPGRGVGRPLKRKEGVVHAPTSPPGALRLSASAAESAASLSSPVYCKARQHRRLRRGRWLTRMKGDTGRPWRMGRRPVDECSHRHLLFCLLVGAVSEAARTLDEAARAGAPHAVQPRARDGLRSWQVLLD